MQSPVSPYFAKNSAARTLDAVNKAVVELLGGEILEGSGFEAEMPETEFHFDWMLPKDDSKGGSR